MAKEIGQLKQCLSEGTDSLRQVPVEQIKKKFEDGLHVVPAVSEKMIEVGSLLSGALALLNEGTIKPEAEKRLFDARQDYEYVFSDDGFSAPVPGADELARRFFGFSHTVRELVGEPNRRGDDDELVRSLGKLQEYLEAFDEELGVYERLRLGMVDQANQAVSDRTRTIEQANHIDNQL